MRAERPAPGRGLGVGAAGGAWVSRRRCRWRWLATVAVGLVATGVVAAATPWHVPQADVRFELEITAAPSVPCAGVVATVPDGGLLPRGSVEALVFDAAGTELRSATLGHNPKEHYRLVFAAPASGQRVWVYFRPGIQRPVGPEFCPSLLFYYRSGVTSLEAARQLTAADRGGLVDQIGRRDNPFGPDENFSSRHTGFLQIVEPGRYYFAALADDEAEARVAGQTVSRAKYDTPRRGANGTWVELGAGPQPVEFWHWQGPGGLEMHLLWRTPGMAADALPVTVPATAFVQSGRAVPVAATTRSGAPAAWFEYGAESYLWLGDRPLNVFQFRAQTTGTWEFAGGLTVKTDRTRWLLEGDGPHEVTFTVGSSRGTLPVWFGNPPGRANLKDPNQRRVYQELLRARCRAVPAPRRPCADWSASFWATLAGVTVPGEGRELLDEVFGRSRADVLALKTEERWALEDRYFELLRLEEPTAARAWLERFLKEERDNPRRFGWQIARVELWLYELDDVEQARASAAKLMPLANAAGSNAVARLQVRQGDIERLAGQVDRAREIYAAVQRSGRDWRAAAVRQASYFEEVKQALRHGALETARDRLAAWEIELPLSKLDGDYILAEAHYWMAVRQDQRALRNLLAFRQQTNLSPFLPEAMKLERDCLVRLKRHEELAALAADLEKRFPTLPLTRETVALARRLSGR